MKSLAIAVVALLGAGSASGAEDVLSPLPEGKKGGIVITIDDGTVDHYEIAAPTLEKYGMRGIFNIIGSRVGQPGYMTWDQLRDLVKRGHELGNHTWTHPNLNRVVDWAASRDDIDKEKVTYYGISQGGGFGLYLAGLHNRSIRKYVVNVPGFSDLLCEGAGRQTCVPKSFFNYDDPATVAKAKRNAPYFDTANFASRVQAPIRFVTGASDWVCPPHTVYAAYNLCSSPDKAIIFNGGDHNSSPEDAAGKSEKWLAE